jgi:hypothetical protein
MAAAKAGTKGSNKSQSAVLVERPAPANPSAPRNADDHVAVALARTANRPKPVEHIAVEGDQIAALAVRASLGLISLEERRLDRFESIGGD